MADATTARQVGARLLGEVEEGSLEELLNLLRANFTNINTNTNPITTATTATTAITTTTATSSKTHHRSHPPPPPPLPIPSLARLAARHQHSTQSAPPPLLSIGGRYLPLLYHLISTLLAPPHRYTVVLVDAEGRFDVTRLVVSSPSTTLSEGEGEGEREREGRCTPQDLRHLYVYRPASREPEQVRAVLEAAREFMLYGKHGSRDREWWGTVVVGAAGGGDVVAGWKGWLRVEREADEGSRFQAGVSVEEALGQRARRQEMADTAGWVASSPWGSYRWA
ncbi:hypothetical protein F4775DRAFT_325973 [Biscogniauxia sp. FL1348]|nr:hypothetical protein F4775DRAFT_325973 [Biscogniauxia sp. FL1348]